MFALVRERRSKKKGSGDSFSPIITANDLAAGWASDPDGDSLYSLVPGGERQHELACAGVSIRCIRSPAITNPTWFMRAICWSPWRTERARI